MTVRLSSKFAAIFGAVQLICAISLCARAPVHPPAAAMLHCSEGVTADLPQPTVERELPSPQETVLNRLSDAVPAVVR